jgi:hypothetical protein
MTATLVKLYVYDLSNGLAKRLSQQYIGQQIDGIWYVAPSSNLVIYISDLCVMSGIRLWLFSGRKYFMDKGFTPPSPESLMCVYPFLLRGGLLILSYIAWDAHASDRYW